MSLQTYYVSKRVKALAKEADMGKLGNAGKNVWAFLDGKKTILWAIVVALQKAFPGLPVWGYVDAAANQLGWQNLPLALDPDQLVLWGTLAFGLGHKAVKAWKETPVKLEWKTIGEVPEIKDLKAAPQVAEAPVAPAAPAPNPKLSDVRSKKQIMVGTVVLLNDGTKGVVIGIKEQSANGYTYSVAEMP